MREAEALADSTDWVKTATEIQALQAEWKSIGPVARGHEKSIWERFRAACDRFFTRRQDDLKRRKEEWWTNLARKEALCAKAEALAESTEWDSAAAQFKQLQAEWKTIGPVRKSRSEAIWQRFRTACDRFFDRFKHRDQLELQEKAAVRDTVIRELEALVPAEGAAESAAPENLYTTVQQARSKWQQAPELPRALQQDLAARYHQAVGAARRGVAGCVWRHRSRSRNDAQAHGEAPLAGRGDRVGAAGEAGQSLANRTAGAAVARTSGRQHDVRRGRASENEESRWRAVRAGSAQRAGAVDAPRAGAAKHRRAAQRALPARVPQVLRFAQARVVEAGLETRSDAAH